MPQETLIWLLVLGALAMLFAATLRRMSALARRTRDLERFQRQVRAMERRLGTIADPFIVSLDEIRRRSGDPARVAAGLAAAQDELRSLASEGRAARAPGALAREAAAFVVELERAERAASLVEHGLDALLADRGGRDLEAQTSLKRGALNLRHAREAAARLAGQIEAVSPADLRRTPATGRAAGAAGAATYLVDADLDVDGR